MAKKIAVTTASFAEFDRRPLTLLKGGGFRVVFNALARKLKPPEVIKLCVGCVGVIAGTEEYSGPALRALPGLKVISRCGSGTENIDLKAAKRMKIKIFNTPDAPALAVAELTLGLILGLLRRIRSMDRNLHRGVWKREVGSLLYGKRIGIIGFGRIGRKVCGLLRPFSCRIAYTDPFVKEGFSGAGRMPLGELLRWADIVAIHAASRGRIIGAKEFRLMKKGAWLLNLSRGTAVDEQGLYNAIKGNRLAGAAVDVFDKEPYAGTLAKLDNVILTPHIGSFAKETRVEMEMQAVRNLLKGLKGA
jgi:D-3-phosphoglycerate dehydrogenase